MALVYNKRPAEQTALIRRSVQLAFLLLNLWIGANFYLWVRHFETGGDSVYVPRPAGVEGWLPIAALMNLKYTLVTGLIPEVHPAGMFLLVAFLAISFFFRKAFCSWLCPIGTISEWLWQGGEEMFGKTFKLPKWADYPLRTLKYVLLFLFVYVVVTMSADELRAFLVSPYGMVADVKMLDFFRAAGRTTIIVCSVLVILSVVTKNFWCRYLCPYGALMGIAAVFSPLRITRDPISCIDCGKCAKACPSLLPVDKVLTVKTPECNGCFSCVTVCPVKDALEMRTLPLAFHRKAPLPARKRIPAPAIAFGLSVVFLGIVGYAKAMGYWEGSIPEHVFFELIPNAASFGHP